MVNGAHWKGDGVSSGLLGLAYPSLTSAFLGTDPMKDNLNTTKLEYNPLLTNIFKHDLVSPVLSLIIKRGSDASYITFGGIPPVSLSSTF